MIIVPSNLNLNTDIHNYESKYKFKYLYIIHTILENSQYDTSFEGYVNLHSKVLEKYLGHRYVKIILNQLEDSGIIEVNDPYSSNNFSKSYRLTKAYREVTPICLELDFPKNFRQKQDKELAVVRDKHIDMYKNLTQVEIDSDKALQFIDSLEVNSEGKPLTVVGKFWYKLAVSKIANKEIKITEDSSGRVHHNLTNFPRVLRQFLRINGERLHSTDVANSQVVLFIPLLNKYVKEVLPRTDIPSDCVFFKELCEQGKFYEHIMQDLGVPLENRQEFKKQFFAKIFYSTGKFEYPETKRFKELFPNVYKAILHYKKSKHSDLPIAMQKTEATLVVGIKINCFYFTCHDAIISLHKDTQYVQGLMSESFKTVGLNPTLKTGVF